MGIVSSSPDFLIVPLLSKSSFPIDIFIGFGCLLHPLDLLKVSVGFPEILNRLSGKIPWALGAIQILSEDRP